ncbi:MAG: pyrroline-5-carboxylate reductase [Ruminococcaceae bacterium]|nr:pyrroline-5-carboxylate reductase [Oscillospiraceae bacterium]
MISFIGNGNMGKAILGGILSTPEYRPEMITVSDCNQEGLEETRKKFGVGVTTDNKEAAQKADILLLCVKPQILYSVIAEIRDVVNEECLIVSIAAGQSMDQIEAAFGREMKIARVMPNTPALVGAGMSAIATNLYVTGEEYQTLGEIFGSFGKTEFIPEHLMDAVTAVSGSSPAYIFMMIEAMADAAVAAGMPRAQAYTFAAQATLGSAKMVLETGMHPGALKDMVCSPAGTTIEAVKALEESGFRAAIMNAMQACVEKSKSL